MHRTSLQIIWCSSHTTTQNKEVEVDYTVADSDIEFRPCLVPTPEPNNHPLTSAHLRLRTHHQSNTNVRQIHQPTHPITSNLSRGCNPAKSTRKYRRVSARLPPAHRPERRKRFDGPCAAGQDFSSTPRRLMLRFYWKECIVSHERGLRLRYVTYV